MDSSNARRRACTRLCLARLNVTAYILHRDRVQIAHTPTLARTQPVDLVVPIVPFVHIFSPRWVQRIPEHKFADKRGALRWRYFVPRLGLLPERFHPYLQLCGGGLCMFVCVSEIFLRKPPRFCLQLLSRLAPPVLIPDASYDRTVRAHSLGPHLTA